MIKVAPSILSADFAFLYDEVKRVEKAGADLLHIDVMDGRFVPNITVGPPVISCLKGKTTLPLDVHLMIEDPDRYLDDFINAGAHILTVHMESCVHIHRTINTIKNHGVIPAVALNPSTPLTSLEYILEDVGMVLIMTVNPGFGGQSFIPRMLEKIKALKTMIESRGLDIPIEVDGGVNQENAGDIVKAGARILVAGSAIYNSEDPSAVIKKIKELKTPC
ncbi:ribulose-phosphate 3-epimerase [Thermoanaerobacterium sp. DL9XJH110]|uniref:ribulose-phosphate 3-epimerase n=1 Tax=Thermoanaerobacterium sp. DL9XJH110 TaxID=3386643 RepID=UPI003BB4EFA2